MLAAALQAEVAAYIDQFAGLCDENGRRLVVRNGTAEPRTVVTSAGAVEVMAPRVNDKRTDPATGERMRFSSAILPPWARKTPQVSEVLPLLYLHGLSSGDFVPALGQFLGSHAGLSASTITKLTQTWTAEAAVFMTRDLSGVDYVYLWVDGIHLGIRLGEGKLCLLVMIGVRADGRKELVALADGVPRVRRVVGGPAARLRPAGDARPGAGGRGRGAGVLERGARGVPAGQDPALLVSQDRERARRAAEVRAPGREEGPGRGIWNAEDKDHARTAVKAFAAAYGAKFPKAAAKITEDEEELLAFYNYPAEHWVHLRTTNPIESTFATVRLRTKVTKGHGSKATALAMAFKLIESAQRRWRMVNVPHLVALVRAGAVFVNGKLVERPEDQAAVPDPSPDATQDVAAEVPPRRS